MGASGIPSTETACDCGARGYAIGSGLGPGIAGIQRMRVRIHRGTQVIGGTCIEIEAQGKRVVLDVGLPLDAPDEADAACA